MSGKADKKGKAAVHFRKAACVMERFIAEAGTTRNRPQPENRAVLDPLKPDLNAWLQKYMKSRMLGDFLRKHPDLQDDLVSSDMGRFSTLEEKRYFAHGADELAFVSNQEDLLLPTLFLPGISEGSSASVTDVERNWHKRVLAIKYLQLKEELEAGQPSKGPSYYKDDRALPP
ncbi:hypothetical protein AK812_SmicGene28878 [Symbiodinium microadriaticum]|uniref:Uncharacterized protein n=1 Tax=Symbiodinium microadriaticum TaxID=2951 RepID=A0A1Q9D376_SYMMI|nr:hypothetical protein AK812_SmicGene28878 [Symbiodinium microadriaticum]